MQHRSVCDFLFYVRNFISRFYSCLIKDDLRRQSRLLLRAFSADSASVEYSRTLPQLRLEKTHINVAISPPVEFREVLNWRRQSRLLLRAFSADSASVEYSRTLPQLRLEKTLINVAILPPVAFMTALNGRQSRLLLRAFFTTGRGIPSGEAEQSARAFLC